MKWYLSKIIFRILTPDKSGPGQFEEKIRLIRAQTKQDALQKASAFGENEESEFTNAAGRKIGWEFIAVSELRLLPQFTDGIELNSHLEEMPAMEEFISLQRDKHRKLFLSVSGDKQPEK
ncbi:MAG TPA: DUF4288 domain-containing protein [Chitinophagaceae bacterium]|jgi:hypothetical protein|nr:DUF4288 domain-containing protein [Chitinophagaceae bacterium]